MTRVFEHRAVALPQGKSHCPECGPGRRVLNGQSVLDRAGVDACKTLDQMEVSAGAPEIGLVGEIRRVDDQRIAFPATARVAYPLPQLRREMLAAVDRHNARLVDHLGDDDDVPASL